MDLGLLWKCELFRVHFWEELWVVVGVLFEYGARTLRGELDERSMTSFLISVFSNFTAVVVGTGESGGSS